MPKFDPDVRRLPEAKRRIVEILGEVARERDLEKFRAFVTLASLALRQRRRRAIGQPVDQEIERQYADTVKKWDERAQKLFGDCLGATVLALNQLQEDVLGPVFMAMDLGSSYQGQFFTPPHVSALGTLLAMGDVDEVIAREGFVTLHEPTCGAGGMIIAYAEVLRERGYDPRQHLLAVAIDRDRLCADMTYVQLALLGIPAVVIHGDALTGEEWWRDATVASLAGLPADGLVASKA